MTKTLERPMADPAAFRSIFATPDEKLIVALVEPGQDRGLSDLVDMVAGLRKQGSALKLVVYGDSSAILPTAGGIGFLESWARPLLSPVLSQADAVIPLGEASEALLLAHRELGCRMPSILRDWGDLRDLFKPSPSRITSQFVLQNDWGIGDELLLSAVAREIKRAHPETDLWIRSRHGFRFPSYVRRDTPGAEIRRVETIYQNTTLYGPHAHSPFPGHLVQQMLDKFALDTGLRTRAVDVRPQLEIRAVSKTPQPTVVLHTRPNPRLPSKDWGLRRWEKLGELLRASGVRLRQVGGKDEVLLPGAEDLRGRPVGELPEIFAESWAVVCVVGFLMHLAEAARTPAIVIYGGREHPAIDGYPDHLHLSSEPLPCRGRWGCHLAPDLECPHGMKCMERLTPELVFGEIFSTLSRGGAR